VPERINPNYDLGPCLLDLTSLEEITDLVSKNFAISRFSAVDDTWEVYDERRERFLEAIADREGLQSFSAKAETGDDDRPSEKRYLSMVFDEEEAKLSFVADPKQLHWFEHFMFDLRKHIHPPQFVQRLAHAYRNKDVIAILLSAALVIPPTGGVPLAESNIPYSRIVIREKEPNPLAQSIKANLISSLIWAIIVIIVTIIVQWVAYQFGIDLTPWE
jgi:hypothetical protein